MTLNFYISYLVPVKPEQLAELKEKIARAEKAIASVSSICAIMGPESSFDRQAAELSVSRLRAQMEPERRREPAVMRGNLGRIVEWFCPKCDGCIAVLEGRVLAEQSVCPSCGAEVHKEELPMPLDLYHMRTRRTDGVEVQRDSSGI